MNIVSLQEKSRKALAEHKRELSEVEKASEISIIKNNKPARDRSWKGWIKPAGGWVPCNGSMHVVLVDKFAQDDKRIANTIKDLNRGDNSQETAYRMAAVNVGYVRVVLRQGGGLVFEGLSSSFGRRGVQKTIEALILSVLSDALSVAINYLSSEGKGSGGKSIAFKGYDARKRYDQLAMSGLLPMWEDKRGAECG